MSEDYSWALEYPYEATEGSNSMKYSKSIKPFG